MERKVPTTQTEEIDLYLRTIYSLLRTTTDVQIRTLEEVHGGMTSSLHPEARSIAPDTSAFIYSLLRLPQCMAYVRTVVLGQNAMVFTQHGYEEVETWEVSPANARRRRCFFDGKETLACYIASRSDIDDVIPTLTAYQIEWNKLHQLLQVVMPEQFSPIALAQRAQFEELADRLRMSVDDLERLQVVWGSQFSERMTTIRNRKHELRVRLLSGSLSEYWRATRGWMDNIVSLRPEILERPVYFISSNTHSVANLLSGFAIQQRDELVAYLERKDNRELLEEWQSIQQRAVPSSEGNFLYYVMKKYQSTHQGACLVEAQRQHEAAHGITRIPAVHSFDVEAQVIELGKLDPQGMDNRLANGCCAFLKNSDALILNIDYPLGLAAYNLLAKVVEYVGRLLGVYVMGKVASLNGVIGDVMIPNVVHDEHSRNTYLFQNAFSATDVIPYLVYGTVLDNQKAVSVLGTFLQNARIMDVFYREGYTDFEMEAGPYLSAAYEMVRPRRHPIDEIVNLYGAPFDLGILHYVSDTPLSKGKNLGAGTLSYFGMDSTYATTLAILRRIVKKEEWRAGGS
ncbi:MAG TPA: hypothetical protein VLH85_02395 [Levilinea sp.]|nr:hypothetical protein [Levilinea sp.]